MDCYCQKCDAAQTAYYNGQVPLNAVEGFIRQILGWREYVRGIYWLCMPDYSDQNTLQASTPLPQYYWTGNTKWHVWPSVSEIPLHMDMLTIFSV